MESSACFKMACTRIPCLLKNTQEVIIIGGSISKVNFSSSSHLNGIRSWRINQGLDPSPKRYSPLTLLPDYSFLDGRPRPIGHFQMKKKNFQKQLCEKIVNLSHELDVGLELFHKRQAEKEEEKRIFMEKRLKVKGAATLKKKNK